MTTNTYKRLLCMPRQNGKGWKGKDPTSRRAVKRCSKPSSSKRRSKLSWLDRRLKEVFKLDCPSPPRRLSPPDVPLPVCERSAATGVPRAERSTTEDGNSCGRPLCGQALRGWHVKHKDMKARQFAMSRFPQCVCNEKKKQQQAPHEECEGPPFASPFAA